MDTIADKLLLADLAPVSITEDGSPLTLRSLLSLSKERTQDAKLQIALGNTYLRTNKFKEAIKCLNLALKLSPSDSIALKNSIIALTLNRQFKKALTLCQNIETFPEYKSFATLYRSRISLLNNKPNLALKYYQELLLIDPQSKEAKMYLNKTSLKDRDFESSKSTLDKTFKEHPNDPEVKTLLTRLYYNQGLNFYQNNDFEQALRIWGEAHRNYQISFSKDDSIGKAFAKIRANYNKDNRLKKEIRLYRSLYAANTLTTEINYSLFNNFYFSIGLLPEHFLEMKNLQSELAHWQHCLEAQGEHPYSHFKIAFIYSYLGLLDTAINEIEICIDNLPPKKHSSLRLKQVRDFLRLIIDLRENIDSRRESSELRSAWEQAGFSNNFEITAWRKTGLSPIEAASWRALNISPAQAKLWFRQEVAPELAIEWSKAGFHNPKVVKKWIKGGFSPLDAKIWGGVFQEDIEKAVQWSKVGFKMAKEAFRWSCVFSFPWDASQWRDLGFSASEARGYLAANIKDPFLALQFRTERQKNEKSDVLK
jgi:tetratricopeptide (TPR) repeat protein